MARQHGTQPGVCTQLGSQGSSHTAGAGAGIHKRGVAGFTIPFLGQQELLAAAEEKRGELLRAA